MVAPGSLSAPNAHNSSMPNVFGILRGSQATVGDGDDDVPRISGKLGDDTAPPLVAGEIVLSVVQNVRFCIGGKDSGAPFSLGNCYLTGYRLVFSPYAKSAEGDNGVRRPPRAFDELSIPWAAVARMEQPKSEPLTTVLWCKDQRELRVSFEANATFAQTFLQYARDHAFPSKGVAGLFAFKYRERFEVGREREPVEGWAVYDFEREFRRQGVLPDRLWRVWDDNYTLVATYPRRFILPVNMSESEIVEAARFRSKHRLPSLTYRHAATGALLSRSSQPMVGVGGHRCLADEKLLNLYRLRGDPNDTQLDTRAEFYIFDARRFRAATGNQIAGKGVENERHYHNTKVVFCNIENIHAMRASVNALADLLILGPADDTLFMSKLDETGWLGHVRQVVDASVQVAEKLAVEGASVLVHCSDGWDRTAQMVSTAQLLLDPYFRTLEGFAVLVEKDWCQFGHKFHDRCGHGESNYANQDRSPIFVQWLDVVHQLLRQFPACFEFSEELLVFLADHLFSGLFGTFFGNSDRLRKAELECPRATVSVWTYVLNCRGRFVHPRYRPFDGIIWPSSSARKMRLWERYFLRWDPDSHPRTESGAGPEWRDDYGALGVGRERRGSGPSPVAGGGLTPLRPRGATDSGDAGISRPLSNVTSLERGSLGAPPASTQRDA